MNAVRIELMPAPAKPASNWNGARGALRQASGYQHELRTAGDVALDALQAAGVEAGTAVRSVANTLADRAESAAVMWRRAASSATCLENRRRNLGEMERNTATAHSLRHLAKRAGDFGP